ncbi:4Fe-4S binding protein [Clostridium botulinum]|uniref:(Fe-S)-binding protein n=1 Tax=Clostridium botulinum C/D str. DC5 TaxID=1443128 RepID=A0A0A0IJY4_CLOBO|nr:4Fe-4S binding protein [Clostridium botulinum]KGN01765.1 (Fe-S)-binding protein [Clostridium botulinum C/D str. DC5]KOC54362.1 (Fe-S)-binding protein [Clostridium botulinum]KOC58343.1 (Fe-S)-binding protein [Clostridium botulinum]MCD3234978.1 4Fe-4S binding protein [Clostridium botulinum D/C]MCD3240856.1 4Fe-4S binding protein [Clostridium botulinum D/C]
MLKLWKKYSFIILIVFIVGGIFNIKIAMAAIVCMLGPLILALLGKGRFWCGNICPRGSFYDNIVKKFSNKKRVPGLLKSKIFRVLVIVFMFYMFGIGIYMNWGNIAGIAMIFYKMIVVTTLVGLILSIFYNHRSWCNFCPMGSIAAFISHFKKNKKTLKVNSSCISCKLCQRKCPMGIVPYDYKGDILKHVDCIQCGECVKYCPKNSIKY